ncbi:MAG: hypothetical protein NVS9B15_19400 [Acidobacteriaceae bacterium]
MFDAEYRVRTQAATVLELTRTDRLFDIYETSTEAVRSFNGFVPDARGTLHTLAA